MEFNIERSIEMLSATPSTLRALLGNLSDVWTCDQTRDPGSDIPDRAWEPYDIIGHLIHGEETDWIPRAKIILAQGADRTFLPFDRFAQFDHSQGKTLAKLLEEFEQRRAVSLDTLRSWDLTEADLDLEGTHPEFGSVTLRQLLATWVVHDLNHIRQVVAAMAGKYRDEVGPWKAYLLILRQGEV